MLRFNPDAADPSLLLSLSPEKLRTAPEYKDNPRPQTLMGADRARSRRCPGRVFPGGCARRGDAPRRSQEVSGCPIPPTSRIRQT